MNSPSLHRPANLPKAGLPRRSRFAILIFSLTAFLIGVARLPAVPAPDANSVLILDTTVTNGGSSVEAIEASNAGFTVVVVNAATWAATTAAEFATYRALILGDPTCGNLTSIAPAVANRTTWSPKINGNIILIGTDEVFHDGQGGRQLTINAVKFAADRPGKTGLLACLSCYYFSAAPVTPVPLLDQIGTFTVTGVGCYNDAHIVATHTALAGLNDASLSNWSCSVHEAWDTFPASFIPLVIANGISGYGSLSFPDGSLGVPYVIARGEGLALISSITLTPSSADNPIGTIHTVTATVTTNDPVAGTPVVGTTVTFAVNSGPNAGVTGTSVTNSNGQATFSYTGTGGIGTDIISATFVDAKGATQTSNNAVKNWVRPPNTPPDVSQARPSIDCIWPANHKFVPISIDRVTDAEHDPITIVITAITSDEPTATVVGAGGKMTHVADASGVGTKTANVRAERSGTGDGRVYEITFSASDGKASSIGKVRVKVPHDQSPKSCLAVDNGQIYDATQNN